jgi:uncharacterized membrane protein
MTAVQARAVDVGQTDSGSVGDRRSERLPALDLLRGLVMVVMALDHVRDYYHNADFDPLDLSHTTAAIFLTRWITHFCAPVFVFLAGTGAFLYGSRRTPRELSRFLWTRGLWLIFLELTWVRFAWTFDPDFRHGGLQVIWVLGVSMIVLAALVRFPLWLTTTFGVVMVAAHNLLDPLDAVRPDRPSFVWAILHEPSRFGDWDGWGLGIRYPLIPWIGVMAAGYGFGSLMLLPREARRRAVFKLGLAVCALFVIVRAIDVYGDTDHWSRQPSLLFTLFSFVNVQKYPPSLDYLLMTIGPALLFLAWMDREPPAFLRPLVTFGRVPMFFYLLHIPLIHASSIVVDAFLHGSREIDHAAHAPPADWGFPLPIVYLAWFLIVLALYFPCRWFAGVKQRRREAWLSYL